MILDLVATIGGLVLPPAFDFIKKKFIKEENDTPERTIGSLAATKPEVLPDYVNSLATWYKAQVEWFNRDVLGTPSQWIIDLRAAIRPVTVVGCLIILALSIEGVVALQEGVRLFCEASVSSWMGARLVKN